MTATTAGVTSDTKVALVAEFLNAFAAKEIDHAIDLLAEDVEYTNVSLPTIRGREKVRKLAHATLGRDAMTFEVYTRHAASDDDAVLTERIDVLTVGPMRVQFWVWGRFEVEDGEITVWRDSFDWMNYTLATLRGVAGIFLPPLRAKPPVG